MRVVRSQHPAAIPSGTPWRQLKSLSHMGPLAREITLVLVLKFLLLWLLWHAFFSQPVARHMHLDPVRVEHHLLQTPPASESDHAQR